MKFLVTFPSLLQLGWVPGKGNQHSNPRRVDVEVRIGRLIYPANE